MKYYALMLCVFLACSTSKVEAQIKKTIHYTFNVEGGATDVSLELGSKSKVEIREHKSSRIMVEIHIEIENGNESLLNHWARTGRYDLEKVEDGNVVRIIAAKNDDKIFRKGVQVTQGETLTRTNERIECVEHITYTVYVPEKMSKKKVEQTVTKKQ